MNAKPTPPTDDERVAAMSINLVAYGPTLKVDIGFDPNFKPGPPWTTPVAGMSGIDALVDTGACVSYIDSLLAAQLNLPIVDKRSVSGVHGSRIANVHLAQIHVPSLNFTIDGPFAAVDFASLMHKALIGRTFLQAFTLLYEGPTGSFKLSRP